MSDWVHENTFEPFEFELGFWLQQSQNDVGFDFHDFGGGFGSDGAFRRFVVSEVVRVENVAETSDEVKVIVLFFDIARNNDKNRVDAFTFFDDFFAFLKSLLGRFHSDLYNLVSSKVGE